MAICQHSGILGELEVTPLPDAYCMMEADNTTDSGSTLTVYRNLSLSCDLHINPLSSSQILISVVAGNITGTDYMYIERMGPLGVCSNRYVTFMELLQQPCEANYGNAAIQLHFRGDITVGIQDVMVEENDLECPEDVNKQEMVGALEGQTSHCRHVRGFGSIVHCIKTYHQWWIWNHLEGRWKLGSKPTSRCDMQCPNYCFCVLADRQVVYNCMQNFQYLGDSTRFLLLETDITHLDLSKNGINALKIETFIKIGEHIRYLDLNSNFLTVLPSRSFQYLYALIQLELKNNSLVTLDAVLFASLHNLKGLDLSYNALVTLHVGLFANLYSLSYLELDHNALVTLETHRFINLHKLNELYLIENRLITLDHRVFHQLLELKYLYIDDNRISDLKDGTFSSLIHLETLSVAFNLLTFLPFNIFENLHSLVQLDLSGNKLQTIPQISHMVLLNKVHLFGNPLTKIAKNMFSGVSNTASIVVDQPEVCICYLNDSDTCFNKLKPSPYLTCNRLLPFTALTIFMWVIGFSSIFGNIFVVWRRLQQRAENKVQSLLLSNLAMSDLLMGIYMIIIASADIYYGEYFPMNAESWRSSVLCKIAGTLAITSSEASVLFVTFISIDRFITIKFPYSIHKLRVKSTKLISALVWIFSLTLGLTASTLAGSNSDFYDNSHVCIGLPLAQIIKPKTQMVQFENIQFWKNAVTVEVVEGFDQSPGLYFSVAVFIAFNMICFLLILACYVGLIRAVSKTSSEAFRKREMAEEIRMTLKVSVIVLTDFFCWFPICLMGVFVQISLIELPNSVFAWIVTFVLPINSAVNPFLYTIATVIIDTCSRRTSDPAYIQTQLKRVPSTENILESQPKRVEGQHVAPLVESENTTCL